MVVVLLIITGVAGIVLALLLMVVLVEVAPAVLLLAVVGVVVFVFVVVVVFVVVAMVALTWVLLSITPDVEEELLLVDVPFCCWGTPEVDVELFVLFMVVFVAVVVFIVVVVVVLLVVLGELVLLAVVFCTFPLVLFTDVEVELVLLVVVPLFWTCVLLVEVDPAWVDPETLVTGAVITVELGVITVGAIVVWLTIGMPIFVFGGVSVVLVAGLGVGVGEVA